MNDNQELQMAIDVLVNDFIDSDAPNYKGYRVEDEKSNQQYTIVVHKTGSKLPDEKHFK
ncbi:hypothetical protein pVco5_071 [Vibrio phage pVco-5]|uniref:Uncharacterized protein n=1 Tax=Vibrio phage pVco-5 TaxID=1965485 RepID=A0A1W6JUV8_9CAUD|nr:hypothetical protein KNT61_gp071 [Vibrio phage pVco-5]ARM71059.1 hypothetical protein pVco5_071 [Vibrio phage pVco-5]